MHSNRQRILCVDNHASRNLVVLLLEQANYEVVTASTLADAVRLARSERCDLYLLNHQLLEGAGGETCDELRAVAPDTPVLFYSTVTYPYGRRRAVSCGTAGSPMKPIDVSEVAHAVSQLLQPQAGPAGGAHRDVLQASVRPTVMVVEDYDDTRHLLRVALETRGYRVVEAADGRQAVKAARREHPDLILMDLHLPVFDGLTATDLLRGHEETRAVPIVAMTAYDSEETRADASSAGCNEYLTKPVDLDQLQQVISRLVS